MVPAFPLERLELIKEAKAYVDAAYALRGALATTTVKIQIYDASTDTWEDMLPTANIDYVRYSQSADRMTTSVGVNPPDVWNKVKKREEVEVSLQDLTDLDGDAITPFTDETIQIDLDGQKYYEYSIGERNDQAADNDATGPFATGTSTFQNLYQIGIEEVILNEVTDLYTVPGQLQRTDDFEGDLTPVLEYVKEQPYLETATSRTVLCKITCDIDYDIEHTWVRQGSLPANGGDITCEVELVVALFNHDTAVTTEYVLDDDYIFVTNPSTYLNLVGQFNGTYTQSLTIPFATDADNSRVWVFVRIKGGPAVTSGGGPSLTFDHTMTVNSYELRFEELIDFPATQVRGLLVWEYLLRLCQKMTGLANPLRSAFFGRTDGEVYTYGSDGAGAGWLVTNGFQIRQFPLAERPIYGTFKQAIEALNAVHNIGVGVLEVSGTRYIVIEPIEYFYDATDVQLVISNPKEFEQQCAQDLLFSKLEFGNEKYEAEQPTILRSPHTPRVYTTGLDAVVKNDYKFENPAIMSAHLIEQMRQDQYIADGSRDNRNDDEMVLINVKRDGGDWIVVHDDELASIAEYEFPETGLNLLYTPNRTLLNHAKWFRGGMALNNAEVGVMVW
jgi:hypothetical protein